jgi:hypothetical protein
MKKMKKLIIKFNKESDRKFMSDLAKRLGFSTEEITEDDVESYMLGNILENTDTQNSLMLNEAAVEYQRLKKKK